MKRLFSISAVLLLLFYSGLVTSCTTMYMPGPVNVPLFSSADEFQPGLGVGNQGYNLTMAYSPAYSIGIIGSGCFNKVVNDSTLKPDEMKLSGDIGVGYYAVISKFARLEFFAGYGTGKQLRDETTDFYRKYFFQPNVGVSGRYIDAGITTGMAYVSHFRSEINGARFPADNHALFLEPALTFRAGYENFKFTSQAAWSFPLSREGFSGRFRTFGLSFGIHLTFGKDYEAYFDL